MGVGKGWREGREGEGEGRFAAKKTENSGEICERYDEHSEVTHLKDNV